MKNKKILSYAASLILFVATAIMIALVINLDTSGGGITNAEFIPLRNCMFAIGLPCLIKFYISCDKGYKEDKKWILGYVVCGIVWTAFVVYAAFIRYFINVRTMCFSSFILICVAFYLEYSMIEK